MVTFFTSSASTMVQLFYSNSNKNCPVATNKKEPGSRIRISFFLLMILLLEANLESVAQGYNWKNVQINGGGFVSGVVYNPAEQNLLYARTDVGGAYRWNAVTQTWTALNDALSAAEQNYTGVLSIAADPSDANRVYLAAGLYTASWAGTGAILASSNKGNTWTKTALTIKIGGNEDGRNAGERLMVDPNKGSVLYFGSNKDGLWKSTNYAATWNKVGSFPVATSTGAGISFILFDKNSAVAGNVTQTIYVGVMQTGSNNLFKSIDGGTTWNAVADQPTTIMPHRGVLASDGMLYLTYSDAAGPNGVSTGAVWKYNTGTGAWTNINPPAGQGGYGGITVDPANPQTIVVSTLDRWYPKDEIYRSTNGGGTWKAVLTGAVMDNSSAPYTNGFTPHWIGDVQLDPFNANKAWFVTGYGVYSTVNLTNADANNPVTWTFSDKGLEETVVLSLIAPPTGAPLISTVGDVDGFRHTNLDASPASRFSPAYGTTNSIDFAQNNSNYLVKSYNSSGGNYGSWSNDQGISWTKFPTFPAATNGGGNIAISATATNIVWSPAGAAVSYSTNFGASWTASAGTSSGLRIIADRVNTQKFYSYDDAAGNVLVSTNGGAAFSLASSGLPTLPGYNSWQASLKSVFGVEGDLWLTSGANGLYRSVNSGTLFTKFANVQAAYKVAFGKAAPGKTFPTVYIVGDVNNLYGFYRSIDAGVSWTRINDDDHQFGGINALAADANTYGRVYLGTGGRGVVYGDDAGGAPCTNVDSCELVNLYNTKNGINWVNKTNWLTAQPLSTWYGITTNATGNVTSIALPGNNLTGTFPSAIINNLTSLTAINLSNNSLTGSLSSLSNASLVTLNIRANQLSGTPGTLTFPALQTFNIGNNSFSGNIPAFTAYAALKVYNVDSNYFTGGIPYVVNTVLQHLDVSNNLLSGALTYLSYSALLSLDVSYNQFSGALNYYNYPLVQSLNFSHNKFTGGIPYFNGLASLQTLHIENNKYTFTEIEPVVGAFPMNKFYNPQDTLLRLRFNANKLSVSSGGTLANNTYKWYFLNGSLFTTTVGDSTSTPLVQGTYYVWVTNSAAPQLTLKSDSLMVAGGLPLPVKLAYFSAALSAKNGVTTTTLQWQTFTELNTRQFDIERSVDGINWKLVTTLPSKAVNGNSEVSINYAADDIVALNGVIYYRLKIIDKDGSSTYSQVATVSNNIASKIVVSLCPNPMVKNTLTVKLQSPLSGQVMLSITGMEGQVVYSRYTVVQRGNNIIQLNDLNKMAGGIYLLKTSVKDGSYPVTSVRFFKQ
ncbi:MAG: T9SS type A sorting domain-containing protein [Ferruginibacter sp.]